MQLSLAYVLTLIGAAAAATTGPYTIGAATNGFEKGVLNATLICQVRSTGVNLNNQQIGLGVSAILPNKVNNGQSFRVTAATRLIVPASVNNLAYGFGARTYNGQTGLVTVNAQGSTPSSINAAATPLQIPNATVVQNGVSILNVPQVGSSITVGTFKAPTSGSGAILFSFGQINATIFTYDANGKQTFLTANVSCPAQTRPASLAAVAYGGSGSTSTITPSTSVSIPTIPGNSTAGATGFTYSCNFANYGTAPVRLSIAGAKANNAPVASGSTIAISKGQGNIYASQALVDLAKSKQANASKFKVTVSTLTFTATNASPASKNGITTSAGVSSAVTALTSSAVATIPSNAPTGTLPDISFTAGASGTTALTSVGNAAGSLVLYDSANTVLDTVPFTCAALTPAIPLLPFDIL